MVQISNLIFTLNNYFYVSNIFFLENYVENPEDCNTYITQELKEWLTMAFSIFKIVVPTLIFILSTVDFVVAAAASKEEDMKKATDKLIKRLILAVLFFLIPVILNWLLGQTLLGGTCGVEG